MIGRRAIIQALVGAPLGAAASRIANAAPSLESPALSDVIGSDPEVPTEIVNDVWSIQDLANALDTVRMPGPYDHRTPSVQSMRSWSPAFKAQVEAEKQIEFHRRRAARRRWASLAMKAAGELSGSTG